MRRRDMLLMATAMMAAPAGLRAQQKPMPVIGYLSSTSPTAVTFPPFQEAFLQGLSEKGYVDGRNVVIEYRYAEGRLDRLPALAADLVDKKVDLILASGGITGALAAKGATSTIPIVFVSGDDPVERGLVASFARPGGNLTGVGVFEVELMGKRVELISELVPNVKVIALISNPKDAKAERMIQTAQDAGRAKEVRVHVLNASTEAEIDAAFATLVQLQAGALIVGTEPFLISRRDQLVALAARYGVPAIYGAGDFGAVGGLISYAPSLRAAFRQLGVYAAKILNGAKPADLPVEQPARFELVVNLKTAKALGLTVPPSILARADEVIE
jgi:putative ABC transport system substrate-binding protein